MNSEALIWTLLPLFVAAGSSLLSFFIMQARLEVAVAREREVVAQLRAQLSSQKELTEEKVRKAEEETSRRSLDTFLGEFRVEERHYMKESKSLFVNKKSMVLQERLFFRNIPLSNWVEHEMTMEEGGDVSKLAQAASVFTQRGIGTGAKEPTLMPKLLREQSA
ncbi:MAG: hypothetical protein FJW30_02545 [Acidobacteria bacterium]|nr:hypothetical protein [Acidobacteriota bacterium]